MENISKEINAYSNKFKKKIKTSDVFTLYLVSRVNDELLQPITYIAQEQYNRHTVTKKWILEIGKINLMIADKYNKLFQ